MRGSDVLASFPDIRPRVEPYVLSLGDAPAAAALRGRVVVEGGPLPPHTSVRLFPTAEGPAGDPPAAEVKADGTFTLAAVPAGRYRVALFIGDDHAGEAGEFTLAPASTADLGALPMRAMGALQVRLAANADGAQVFVHHQGLWVQVPQRIDDGGRVVVVDPIPAGSYDLLVWGPSIAPTRAHALVAGGRSAQAMVVPTAAASCTVTFTGDGDAGRRLSLCRDGDADAFDLLPRGGRDELVLGLPAGRWSLTWREHGSGAVLQTRHVVVGPAAVRVEFGAR
jgi:hypothetical protein